jgi:hypothetical protein
VSRPVLLVKLVNGPQSLSCLAIVDSGADYCAFPQSFASVIGLDLLTLPSSQTLGVGGNSVSHYANIQIDLGPLSIPVYCGFTPGLDQAGLGLLGQQGFFDKFKITFDRAGGLFHIDTP